MKILFLIADGMGDWPLDELGGRTVLQAADTPNMDKLATRGMAGQCRTIPGGMPPGSDVANMALLGFDPARYHTGRGPIEAAAQGLKLAGNDLVFRMNLVTIDGAAGGELGPDSIMHDYAAGHVDNATAEALVSDLQHQLGDETFTFYPGIQYRHLLVQKGGGDAPEASIEIRPPHDILDKPIGPDLAAYASSKGLGALVYAAAKRLARAQNASKANAIWPWGQGRPLSLPSFAQTFGIEGAVITAVDLVKGLGLAAGLDAPEVPGVTGLLDTNYEGKVAAALSCLETSDFVYLHVEAPDECGHGGNAQEKIEAIRRFDERIVGPAVRALEGTDAAFLIACDHLTPVVERTHVDDPVPFLLAWPGCTGEQGLTHFDEAAAASTGLALDNGFDLLPWVLKTVGVSGV